MFVRDVCAWCLWVMWLCFYSPSQLFVFQLCYQDMIVKQGLADLESFAFLFLIIRVIDGAAQAEVEKVRHPGILDARKFLKNQHLAESFWPNPLPIRLPMIKQVTKAFVCVLTSTFFNTKKELSIETDRIFAESFWPEHQDARNPFNFFHLWYRHLSTT